MNRISSKRIKALAVGAAITVVLGGTVGVANASQGADDAAAAVHVRHSADDTMKVQKPAVVAKKSAAVIKPRATAAKTPSSDDGDGHLRHGADDGVGHLRHGADDGPGHLRHSADDGPDSSDDSNVSHRRGRDGADNSNSGRRSGETSSTTTTKRSNDDSADDSAVSGKNRVASDDSPDSPDDSDVSGKNGGGDDN